jgi:hypothetical protein
MIRENLARHGGAGGWVPQSAVRTVAGLVGLNAGSSCSALTVCRAAPVATNKPRVVAASAHFDGPVESPLAKFFIGGGVTVAFEAFMGGHPLEFMKIAKQTSTKTYPEILRSITAERGMLGLLDGFVPWGLLQCIAKGAVFSWGQAQAMSVLHGNTVLSEHATTILTGGLGGFAQGVVMSPLLLLKTRVMTDPVFRTKSTTWQSVVNSSLVGGRIIRDEGFMVLTKGMGLYSTKRFADWTTRFAFVELLEMQARALSEDGKISNGTKMLCGLGGGTLSALVTIPMDVAVAIRQAAAQAGGNTSMVDVFRQKLAEGTLLEHSTRGLVARVAHVALTTMLMKQVTSAVYRTLYG